MIIYLLLKRPIYVPAIGKNDEHECRLLAQHIRDESCLAKVLTCALGLTAWMAMKYCNGFRIQAAISADSAVLHEEPIRWDTQPAMETVPVNMAISCQPATIQLLPAKY